MKYIDRLEFKARCSAILKEVESWRDVRSYMG
jgi:hypothetical protein